MTRTVADAALLLDAIAGPDPRDGATADARPQDFTRLLDRGALEGARLGVVRAQHDGHPGVEAVFEGALAALRALGAVLVDPVTLELGERLDEAELEVLLHELRDGLRAWLSEFAPQAAVATLGDVIEWNREHAAEEMPWFGQELFEQAEARGEDGEARYLDALATCRRLARDEGIDAALASHGLDALVAPTAGVAWLTDLVGGDHHEPSFSGPAAVAGYPHLTVPAGLAHGLPVGLSFVGPAWSEPLLLGLGFAFEQATRARRPPTFVRSVSGPEITGPEVVV
jgi:amidase